MGMDLSFYRRLLTPSGIRSVGRELIEEIVDDRVTGLAAEIAFFGVLSTFPGLLMMASALGSLDGLFGSELASEAQMIVQNFMARMLTNDASQTIDAVRDLFEEKRSGVLTLSGIGALLALTRGFAALIRALDVAYDLTEKRRWWHQRLLAVGLGVGSVVVAVLMLVIFVTGPLLGGGQAVADLVGLGDDFAVLWDWVRWPTAFVLLVLWASATFHFGPNHKSPWSSDLPGAIVSSVLWLLVSVGFSVYLRLAADFNQVLGILGGGLILLVWLYLLSVALLIGAELNAILTVRAHKTTATDTARAGAT